MPGPQLQAMDCYLCDQEATQRCPRCGNAYCEDHGEDLCEDCLNPVNAAPTGTFFRASLLALLLGSVLAIWLLIRPPGLPSGSSEIIAPEPTPEPTPEPEGPIEYTVLEGDTISDIATFFGVTVEDLLAVNGLTEEDATFLQPGDVLIIPQ